MFDSLIEYWKNTDLNGNHLIHDADNDLEEKNNQRPDEYKLHLELFPEPFNGNLKDSKIVFLYLNPGYNNADINVKKTIAEDVKKAFDQNYTNEDEYPFLWLNPKYNKCNIGFTRKQVNANANCNPGAYYWNKLFDQKTKTSFLEKLAKERFDNDKDEARKWIAKNVCDIELFPYHSRKFHYSFADCKSADVARYDVFKEIKEHPEVLFVFMRSEKLWINGCKEWGNLLKNKNVIVNPCPRNPSLNPEKNLGRLIEDSSVFQNCMNNHTYKK